MYRCFFKAYIKAMQDKDIIVKQSIIKPHLKKQNQDEYFQIVIQHVKVKL